MRLPSLKSGQVVKVLIRLGFEKIRQTGSHLILVHKGSKKITPVPIHNKNLKRGLLRSIIKQTGLTVKEFLNLL
ncbi:MAG: type II toxin-antitoxin system HicA family toxin [Patescibacteria group bacterium]